jgi:hypothetical protein
MNRIRLRDRIPKWSLGAIALCFILDYLLPDPQGFMQVVYLVVGGFIAFLGFKTDDAEFHRKGISWYGLWKL